MTTATNAAGTVTIAYDNRGRVSSVTDVFGQVVSYGYDANSNRTQLSLNAAISATYQYDVINRLTQLTDNASLNTTFAYDATDKLTSRTLPNGVVSTFQHDALNRLTQLKHAKGANTLADFQYQFNTVNNVTQMTDGAGAHNYSYDALYRLTGATHPVSQPNESYTYDDAGNRTASSQGSSYSYQSFNRLVAANGTSFGHDTNGNQVSKTDASGSWTYTWDYENRLKQATLSGGVTVTYTYDALGRRVQRTSSTGGTTKFIYDGEDVIRDLDGSGNTIADYLNGLGVDNKLRQVVSGTTSYFLSDHLGTTRALADASGAVTANMTYDSFGATNSTATRYTFTGREQDPDLGLIYYRARWYDPNQGRFMSEDPIGFNGGINFYAYVDNSPLNYRDPFGLQKKPQKFHGNLDDLCQTVNCKELENDILTLEISLYMRDYVERELFGGKLDPGHEQRIREEDIKLAECRAKYLAKCRGCDPPKVRRIPNRETSSERKSREEAERRRNIAIGAGAAGAFALAGVVLLGGAAAGALILVF
jgi:RHS repeat-associated protein